MSQRSGPDFGPGRSLLDRKPYPRDQAVLSQTMVRNMICHASWQLLILSALIFGVGDVCDGHGNVCTGPVLPCFCSDVV